MWYMMSNASPCRRHETEGTRLHICHRHVAINQENTSLHCSVCTHVCVPPSAGERGSIPEFCGRAPIFSV